MPLVLLRVHGFLGGGIWGWVFLGGRGAGGG